MRDTSRGNRRTVENNEVADEANFDDLVGIFDEIAKSHKRQRGSGATFTDVSEPSDTYRTSNEISRKNYQFA